MVAIGQAEDFIENVSGCGPFQIILLIVVVASIMSTLSFTIVFMSFGNYNPGWRCLDNVTSYNISTSPIHSLDVIYTKGSCDDYNRCQQIEFDPGTSTIVTEWGLLCDKSWMSSLTISVQMAGMLIFSFIAGQLADTIGRKKTLYGSLVLCGILQLVTAFSVHWVMFVVLLFFICGFSSANVVLVMLYVSEYMTVKWRAIIIALPFWYTGATIQAVTSMITKDWRHVQIVGFVLHVLCFIPVFWVPESLRWLEVQRMTRKFESVMQKVSKLNNTSSDSLKVDDIDVDASLVNESRSESLDVKVKKNTIIDIFRHGYALISICLGLTTMIFSMIFYAMTFGTKSLYGDFYINLIVTNVIAIPIFLLALFGVSYMSRKRHTFLMLGLAAVCVFAATGLLFVDSAAAKSIGSTILIAVARVTLDSTWFCMYSRVTEIYPTVVRGIGLGYVTTTARAGGILAPFIIPEDNDRLYIFTIITGALILFTCVLNIPLPETKGRPLKENFEINIHEDDKEEGV